MDKKESFKSFVKKHPKLINYVKENKKTWQDFYELYDLYGEDSTIWKDYLDSSKELPQDIFGFIKNIDLDEFQNGLNSVQKVLEMIGSMNKKEENITYKPRPIYKHFED